MLRKICGPKWNVVTTDWRQMHNEEVKDLYLQRNVITVIKSGKKMRWVGHVARSGERRGAYRVLVERPEGERSVGRLGSSGSGNVDMK
jgi:hypothetical protein